MTILLDTHAFLWFVAGDAKLSARARTLIEEPKTRVLLTPRVTHHCDPPGWWIADRKLG
jgi:PIN domain nuclease of toxin-antitoxin system